MSTDRKSLSFGRYLMAERLEEGISLKEVSQKTRVGVETLILIENEDHSRLPAEVFVKGFISSYAKAIGADSGKAARLYAEGLEVYRSASGFEAELVRTRKRFWSRLIFSLGLLSCIIALAIYGESVLNQPTETEKKIRPPEAERLGEGDQRSTETKVPKEIQTKPIQPSIDTGSDAHLPEEAVFFDETAGYNITGELIRDRVESLETDDLSERLLLKVITVENTWVKVVIDGKDAREYSLKPADRLELEAKSGFSLLIGNATGVKLLVNDKPVPIPGSQGQVVTIQLP